MDELVNQFLKDMKLTTGLNRQRVGDVWSEVSGAGRYTLSTNFDKGVLTCFISSSLVRNQLYFQRDVLLRNINDRLLNDSLFSSTEEGDPIKVLILK